MKIHYYAIAVLFLILMFCSITFADDWEKRSDPPPGSNQFQVEAGYENGNRVQFLLESSGLGLFKSTDDGTTWGNIGLTGVGITAIVDFISRENDSIHVVSSSDGVYKTTDGGTTWQHYTTGIEGYFITDLVSVLDNPNSLIIGTVGHGVFSSTNGGESWQQMGIGLANKTITSIKFQFDGSDSKVYATTAEDGVYVLIGGGNNNWSPINDGSPSLLNNTTINSNDQGELFVTNTDFGVCSSPNDPVFWSVDNPNFLFGNGIVCTQDGEVYASSFGDGVNKRDVLGIWTDFSSGLPEINGYIDVINLSMDYLGFLWVAVIPFEPGGVPGIYRTVNSVTDVEHNTIVTPEDFRLEQNYPNPFNPSTTIIYSVPNSAVITIKIYDVLGNEIVQLVNEEKSIGVYEVTFDANNLSTGTYFYQLQAVNTSNGLEKSFVETRKMILIK